MANKRISELPSATTPLTGSEEMEIVQGGVNKKVTSQDVGESGGVQTVTGTGVDNTDPKNPVINAGGSPGGSTTQVQYNNAGAFAGISGATSNGTILSVTTAAKTVNTTQAASTAMVQARVLAAYVSTGTDNYVVTVDGITAYAAGQVFDILLPNTNTGPVTINVNGLGAKDLYKNVSVPLTSGDIVPGGMYRVYYNGTNFFLVNVQMVNRIYNVEAFGARHDYQTVSTASVTSGTSALTVSAGVFTPADTGKTIRVFGAGAAGADLLTTMTYVSATAVTLGTNASTTISAKQIEWGTDDTVPIQNAINDCHTRGGGTVYLPNGIYFLASALNVGGSGANCQLFIPVTSLSETKRSIKIEGESVIMWPSGPFGAQNLPTKGVILKSVIVGTGTLPCVFGSPITATTPIFENITIITKSITGTTHVAPTMSAWITQNCEAKQFYNCIATTESDPTESASPSGATYGFYLSRVGATDHQSICHNISAANYTYGMLCAEHDYWTRANMFCCLYGVLVNGVKGHPVGIGSGPLYLLWCKYGVGFDGGGKHVQLNIATERWPGILSPSYWFDGVYDIYFPTSEDVSGNIIIHCERAGGGSVSYTMSGTNTGSLSIQDLSAMPSVTTTAASQIVTSASDDQVIARGTGAGRGGFLAQTTNANGQATLYMDNNRGSFASYGGFLVGGSTNASTFFGLTRADKLFVLADGASNLGMAIGTLQNQPIIIGTNNTERARFLGSGELGLGVTPTTTAQLGLPASTTGKAPLRIPAGAAPSSPVNGDIWTETSDLKIRLNGVTYTITKV